MHRNYWRRQIALEDAKRWEAAQIFHFVNKLGWARARECAHEISIEEVEHVIKTHPDWAKEHLCTSL